MVRHQPRPILTREAMDAASESKLRSDDGGSLRERVAPGRTEHAALERQAAPADRVGRGVLDRCAIIHGIDNEFASRSRPGPDCGVCAYKRIIVERIRLNKARSAALELEVNDSSIRRNAVLPDADQLGRRGRAVTGRGAIAGSKPQDR